MGTHYEVANGVVTKYYYAGSQRIARRTDGVLSFILGDHLGSTSLVTDASGDIVSQQYYKAWGETRYTSGTEQTKYGYTGQYSYAADFGLHFYNARWYDSSLSRFAQADSIVPGGVQGYDRYAYTNNSPVNYTDPSGHDPAGTSCYLRGYCDNPNDTWKAAKNYSSPKPFKGYVFIFSCGLETDCPGERSEEKYNNQVPLQPLRENVKFLGGTVIDLGDQESLASKLTYADKVKNNITANSNAKGTFLIGHSFGAGANVLGSYNLIEEDNNSSINLKGMVILDSSLLTGNGDFELPSGANGMPYDTQDKADFVANLTPLFVAHSPGPKDPTDFPRQGLGSEYGTDHYTLANDSGMTNAVINFFLSLVP